MNRRLISRLAVLIVSMQIAALVGGCHHQAKPPAPARAAAPAESVAPGESSAVAAARWTMPTPHESYNTRQGRVVFNYYCAPCHGDAGHGDGFNAYNLDPKPQDLADSTFLARHSDDDLLAVIRSGGGAAGLSAGMPPWGRTLNARQIANVVGYIRALPRIDADTSAAR